MTNNEKLEKQPSEKIHVATQSLLKNINSLTKKGKEIIHYITYTIGLAEGVFISCCVSDKYRKFAVGVVNKQSDKVVKQINELALAMKERCLKDTEQRKKESEKKADGYA